MCGHTDGSTSEGRVVFGLAQVFALLYLVCAAMFISVNGV